MYFIEYVLRETVEKGLETAKSKISKTSNSKKLQSIENLKTELKTLLDELKRDALSLQIRQTKSPKRQLEAYSNALDRLCANARVEATKKPAPLGVGTEDAAPHLQLFNHFVNQLLQMQNEIKGDFQEASVTKPITYQAHAFGESSDYTEDSHEINWLCHFIRERFNYKTSKLAEYRMTKNKKDERTFESKVASFDQTFQCWDGLEALQYQLEHIQSLTEVRSPTSARGGRRRTNASQTTDWNHIARLSNAGLDTLRANINQISYALVFYLKSDASSIQTNQSTSFASSYSLLSGIFKTGYKLLTSVGVASKGTCSPILSEFIKTFQPYTDSASYLPEAASETTPSTYFYETVIKDAIFKAKSAMYHKVEESLDDGSHANSVNSLKDYQLTLLDQLERTVEGLNLAIVDPESEPQYGKFCDAILEVARETKTKSKNKAKEFGFSNASNKAFEDLIDKFSEIINALNADFNVRTAASGMFSDNRRDDANLYLNEDSHSNWLCRFIKRRFDYKIGKLVEFNISQPNQSQDTYEDKRASFDETIRCWSGLEKLFFIFNKLSTNSAEGTRQALHLGMLNSACGEGLSLLASIKNRIYLALVCKFRDKERDIQLVNIRFLDKLHAALTNTNVIGNGSCRTEITRFSDRLGTHVRGKASMQAASYRDEQEEKKAAEEEDYNSDYSYN